MPTANPIKLPVVITADGTQAQAGFAKLRNSMQGLERGFGRYLSRQASTITNMFAGFFTIEALFSGLQKMFAHGAQINERLAKFSSEAIKAQVSLEVAQMEQDRQTASHTGPRYAEVLKEKEAAIPELAPLDVFLTEMSNQFELAWLHIQKQLARAITGEFDLGNLTWENFKETFGFGDVDQVRMLEEQLQKAQNIAPMPVPNLSPEQQPQEVKQSAEQIRILQQQLREQRTLTRQLGAN